MFWNIKSERIFRRLAASFLPSKDVYRPLILCSWLHNWNLSHSRKHMHTAAWIVVTLLWTR